MREVGPAVAGTGSPTHRALASEVACDQSGQLAWISDPIEGRRQDTAALRITGVMDTLDHHNWMRDKGYIGNDVMTPIKKPAHRGLLDWEKHHRDLYSADVSVDAISNGVNRVAQSPGRLLDTGQARVVPGC